MLAAVLAMIYADSQADSAQQTVVAPALEVVEPEISQATTSEVAQTQSRSKRAPILLGKALLGGALLGKAALGAGVLGAGALGAGALGAGVLGAGLLGAGLYKAK